MISGLTSSLRRPGAIIACWWALLALTGCPPDFQDTTCSTDSDCFEDQICNDNGQCVSNVVSPKVIEFGADLAVVQPGGKVVLSWKLEDAASASIASEDFSYAITSDQLAQGTKEFTLERDQTFTLSVKNGVLSDSASVSVKVMNVDAPTISSFGAQPTQITLGQSVTLSWQSEGAMSGRIEGGAQPITIAEGDLASGSAQVSPAATTTYKLVMENIAGSAEREVVVTVMANLPTITSFGADPQTIAEGEQTTLSWEVADAQSVMISDGQQQVDLTGKDVAGDSVQVSPAANTTYTLTATNAQGSQTRQVMVTVNRNLAIDRFVALPAAVNAGQPAGLSWDIAGPVTSIELSDDLGNVIDTSGVANISSGGLMVRPDETRTYTLKASDGTNEVSAMVTVEILIAPTITSFTASPTMVSAGDTVTLSWEVTGATSLALTNHLGDTIDISGKMLTQDSVEVTVNQSIRYQLTATSAGGMDALEIMVQVGDIVSINSFSASLNTVTQGQMVDLSWDTVNATTLSIMASDGTMISLLGKNKDQDTVTVRPSAPGTTYTLIANGFAGPASQAVTVAVTGATITVDSFTATPNPVQRGAMVSLDWTATGATSATLSFTDANGMTGAVDLTGKMVAADNAQVTVDSDTTFVFTVQDMFGNTATANVAVTVFDVAAVNSFMASAQTIVAGQPTTLSWTGTAGVSATLMATDANGATSVDLTGKQPNGDSITVNPAITTTYVLELTDAQGNTASGSVTVTVTPAARITSFTATPDTITVGQMSTLAWTTSDATAVTMTATDANGTTNVDISALNVAGDAVTVSPTLDTTYALSVTDGFNTISTTVVVTVNAATMPSITSFTATPDSIIVGQMADLSWATNNATAVTMTATDVNGTTNVDLTGKLASADTLSVNPAITTTYELTATDGTSSVMSSVTVTVAPAQPAPTLTSFTATPQSVVQNQSTTLAWIGADATSATMTATDVNGTTNVDLTGKLPNGDSVVVSPALDTTYEITLTNAQGMDLGTVMVTVAPAAQLTSFTATPDTINSGEMVVLAWAASGATSATMTATDVNGTTNVDLTGKMANADTLTVSPTVTTTYALTITDGTNSPTASATVTVSSGAGVSITSFGADKVATVSGEAVTLSWQVANGAGVSITDDLGNAVDLTGKMVDADNVVVTPQVTRTYTLVAAGSQGPVSAQVTITVSAAPLLISEVMYDAAGTDTGFEWIEIHNTGDTFVDLSNYSIGTGGTDYTFAKFGLSGTLAPGGCFVVGEGGTGLAANGVAPGFVYDQVISFGQGMQNGATPADGVGLFFSKTVTATSVPIDAVLWGTANGSNLLGENGMPKTELSVDVISVHSLERVSPTSDVFRDQATPTPGRCFTVTQLATTRSANDAAGVLSFTGYGLDFDLVSVGLGAQTLTGCTSTAPGQYACDVAASMQTGAVDVTITETNEYVPDANGGAMLQAVNSPVAQTLAGGFFLEGRLDDPGNDYYCGILDPGMTPTATAGSPINVELQVYLAGSTENGGDLPAGYLVQATHFAPNAVPYLSFGDLGWVSAAKVRSQGNDAIFGADLLSANPLNAEAGYRVSPDNGVNFYYCDRSGAPIGSENGWDVGGGLAISWLP